MTTSKKYLRGAVVLGLLALSAFVSPARAGVGPSTGCSDGATRGPGTEINVPNMPITVHAEVGTSPPYVQLCYSTTAPHNGGPAVTGGWVYAILDPANPQVVCEKDLSPVVLGVDCLLRDDNPTSPGRTLEVTLWLQGTPVTLVAGIELGTPAPLVCLKNPTVYTPVGNFPFTAVGACL